MDRIGQKKSEAKIMQLAQSKTVPELADALEAVKAAMEK